MTNAITGEISTMNSVTAVMTPAMRSTAVRGTVTFGEASIMTGIRLSAGVLHSESRLMFLISAGTTGSNNGVQNSAAAVRRSSRGNQPSRIAATGGRTKMTTRMSAIDP